MKTALEIAMERFKEEGDDKSVALTSEQKARLKKIDSVIDSKVAEKRILFEQRIQDARRSGDLTKTGQLTEELTQELARLKTERETRKEKIRKGE